MFQKYVCEVSIEGNVEVIEVTASSEEAVYEEVYEMYYYDERFQGVVVYTAEEYYGRGA